MPYYKKIVGDRIYLSPKELNDEAVEKYTEWMNDFRVTDYLGGSGRVMTPANEREWLEDAVKRKDSRRNFDIVALNGDKLIGSISLIDINWIDRAAILGIFIGEEKFRNGGYGTEAIKLLLEYSFRYLNLHSVRLEVFSQNKRAKRCYEKCGFKEVGENRESIFVNGKYYGRIQMDILENEFTGEYIRNKEVE